MDRPTNGLHGRGPDLKWLVSPAFDLGWFVGPGVLALVAGLIVGLGSPESSSDHLGLWIAGVVLVDVAHVWASLYRTWLDREARRIHAELLRWTPVLVFCVGFISHAIDARLFWGLLAYVAVFHFIKQQVGFALLYLRAGRETASDRRLVELAIWTGTALPVVYWHANLPRNFAWFVPDDFIAGVPEWIGTGAAWAQVPVLGAVLGRRVWLHLRAQGHPMVTLLIIVTALSWNMGIVWFDDDRVFTLTNVFLHGVPYMALVWVAGGRETVARVRRISVPLSIATFYVVLVTLAFVEEGLWDRLVWHDHASLFGEGVELDAFLTTLVVALLTVPQATHYLLDRWIWKVGPRNPRLAGQLGLE